MRQSSSVSAMQFLEPLTKVARRRKSLPQAYLSPGTAEDYYCYSTRELGKGGFSSILLAVHIGSGTKVAIKQIKKREQAADSKSRAQVEAVLRNEVNALIRLNNSHIIRMLDLFQSPDQETVDMVLELAEEGNLESFKRRGKYLIGEREIKLMAADLTKALMHMHRMGVVHRDLKPENILVTCAAHVTHPVVKISDFGLAHVCDKVTDVRFTRTKHDLFMSTLCGSRLYCAPEVIQKKPYTAAVDHWGLGLILFFLFADGLPYPAMSRHTASCTKLPKAPSPIPQDKPKGGSFINRKMKPSFSTSLFTSGSRSKLLPTDVPPLSGMNDDTNLGQYLSNAFEDEKWKGVSFEAKDILRMLLAFNPDHRFTLEEIASLPWMNEKPSTKISWDKYRARSRRSSAPSALESHDNAHGFSTPSPQTTSDIRFRHGLPTTGTLVSLTRNLQSGSLTAKETRADGTVLVTKSSTKYEAAVAPGNESISVDKSTNDTNGVSTHSDAINHEVLPKNEEVQRSESMSSSSIDGIEPPPLHTHPGNSDSETSSKVSIDKVDKKDDQEALELEQEEEKEDDSLFSNETSVKTKQRNAYAELPAHIKNSVGNESQRRHSMEALSSGRCLVCGTGVKLDQLEYHLLECAEAKGNKPPTIQIRSMPDI